MKLFTGEQIRAWDAYTIEHEPVSSSDLMERAARACADFISTQYKEYEHFIVFCGSGNNGGDGLAIARMLAEEGRHVSAVCVPTGNQRSSDNQLNLDRLKTQGKVKILEAGGLTGLPESPGHFGLIDAIFGTGLSRNPEPGTSSWIQRINRSDAPVIAIDMPSGLHSDRGCSPDQDIVKADVTLTFQVPKIAFMYPENEQFTGKCKVLDIGLHPGFYEKEEPFATLLTSGFIGSMMLKQRPKFAYKGNFGHALLVAGSYGKAGAAVMSAYAALRSGCGLVSVRTPASCVQAVQINCPEAMAEPDENELCLQTVFSTEGKDAAGIGPGIGISQQTGQVLENLLKHRDKPLVLDADALNLLALHPENMKWLGEHSVLTPHVGEFHRLAGVFTDGHSRFEALREFALRHHCTMVLKGAHTCIAAPDGKIFFNTSGNPGMAKGGSGDVLTGLITGLLCRGYLPLQAALTGVYLHGLSGDLAAAERGEEGMTAMDIAEKIPEAIRQTLRITT